jgi:hypothetical protein
MSEVRHLVGAILDRKDSWDPFEIKFRRLQGLVLDAYGAIEAQILVGFERSGADSRV